MSNCCVYCIKAAKHEFKSFRCLQLKPYITQLPITNQYRYLKILKMMFRQVLVIIVLVAGNNVEGRAYRRTFDSANSWLRAVDEFRRNAAQDCTVDLGLVIDNTKDDFSLIKNFTKHLVSKFRISDDGTHVGAILFGETANIGLLFNDLKGSENSLNRVNEQIDAWRADKKSKIADISEALAIADEFLFTGQNGMRSSVKQVLVLFTDGKQPGMSSDPVNIANNLRTKGVKIISVGIGIPDPVELVKISGGDYKAVHWLRNKDKFETIAKRIVESVCKKA